MMVLAIISIVIAVLSAAYSIYVMRNMKPAGVGDSDLDTNSIASPKEGTGIPVYFGTHRVRDANIVYYADIRSEAIRQKQKSK